MKKYLSIFLIVLLASFTFAGCRYISIEDFDDATKALLQEDDLSIDRRSFTILTSSEGIDFWNCGSESVGFDSVIESEGASIPCSFTLTDNIVKGQETIEWYEGKRPWEDDFIYEAANYKIGTVVKEDDGKEYVHFIVYDFSGILKYGNEKRSISFYILRPDPRFENSAE